MAKLIACRVCLQPNCEGCNINTLANMLFSGKFDCLMDEHHCVNPEAEFAPVVHGRWKNIGGDEWCCTNCGFVNSTDGRWEPMVTNYCPECNAKMDLEDKSHEPK